MFSTTALFWVENFKKDNEGLHVHDWHIICSDIVEDGITMETII